MSEEYDIRPAVPEDAEALLEIYAPYVKNTAITFECEVPDIEEFRERIRKVTKKYPYILAEKEGKILGYAYASAFNERAAYDWSVEVSIYVRQEERRGGIGKTLYAVLEERLRQQGIQNLYACIASPPQEDDHLTKDSIYFHEKMGYTLIGTFHKCGYKFERWYDMVWMEKMLGEHKKPKPIHTIM